VTQARWNLIESIFHAALEQPSSDRSAFLKEACAGDEKALAEVTALLAGHQDSGFLQSSVAADAGRVLEQRVAVQPGERLGPYLIEAHIATGGMGVVYRARDTRLDRVVAIKVLRPSASDNQTRQRLKREAQAAVKVQHENICAVYDICEENGREFLVMEYLDGRTLAEQLGRLIPVETALRYAVQIAAALEQAHRRGIAHRDLTPRNIIVTKSGVKLLDFGLASWSGHGEPAAQSGRSDATATNTATNRPAGTLQYMSPEQAHGEAADYRSDVFAFGLILYEMLAGHRAFEQSDPQAVIRAIQEAEPAPLSSSRRDVPAALVRLVDACLVKDPDERWQSAGDLRRELLWIAGSEPATVRKLSRNAFVALAGAGLAGLAAVGFAGYWLRPIPAPRRFEMTLAPPPGSTYRPGAGIALSPDGSRIAFVATSADGKDMLWVRSIGALDMSVLPGTEGARHPFWSPDGKQIAFFAERRVRRIPSVGGPVTDICRSLNLTGGSWGTDDTILFAPDPRGPIYRVRSSGGEPAPATVVDEAAGDYGHVWPGFLADGRRFLFAARSLRHPPKLYLASLDSKSVKPISDCGHAVVQGNELYCGAANVEAQRFDADGPQLKDKPVVITRAGNIAAFSVARNGTVAYQPDVERWARELVWLNRSGEKLPGAFPPAPYEGVVLSPDGRSAAAVVMEADGPHIWIYRGDGTGRTSFAVNAAAPVWSPDGRDIAYMALNRGHGDVLVRAADRSSPERLLVPSPTERAPSSWSPDGKLVVIMEHEQPPANKFAILTIPSRGSDRVPTDFLRTKHSSSQGVLSPDGKWMAYWSMETGGPEVFVTDYPARRWKARVSTNGQDCPQWRRDGRELFFQDSDNQVVAVAVSSRGSTLEIGKPQVLFRTIPSVYAQPFSTVDGKRFLVSRPGERSDSQSIVVVLNSDLSNR
jgi:Tol biopolymer transport system component/predicted Ser/Thr protein kinase